VAKLGRDAGGGGDLKALTAMPTTNIPRASRGGPRPAITCSTPTSTDGIYAALDQHKGCPQNKARNDRENAYFARAMLAEILDRHPPAADRGWTLGGRGWGRLGDLRLERAGAVSLARQLAAF